MLRCAAIASPAKRLECFDALSHRLGVSLPKASASTVSKWKVQQETSAIDDSLNVFVSLSAESTVSGWPLKMYTPLLMLRCKENRTQAYIVTGMAPQVEQGTNGATVTLRFDNEKAEQFHTIKSTTGDMLFFEQSGQSIDLIKRMLHRSTLLFQFVPFHSAPQMTTFDLRGLTEAIKPLRKNCQW
jgi:type VI secretion system protein VasI